MLVRWSVLWFIRITEEEENIRLTNNNPSQQGYAQGDSKGNGLSKALGRRTKVSTRHFWEYIFHAETQMTIHDYKLAEI